MKYLFVLIIVLFQFSNENVFAKNNILDTGNLLSSNDIKIYKQIFSIQSKAIPNKRNCNCSLEWRKVDKLIKKINNKILLGTVYSERYLHLIGNYSLLIRLPLDQRRQILYDEQGLARDSVQYYLLKRRLFLP